jgi:hypothetical protein
VSRDFIPERSLRTAARKGAEIHARETSGHWRRKVSLLLPASVPGRLSGAWGAGRFATGKREDCGGRRGFSVSFTRIGDNQPKFLWAPVEILWPCFQQDENADRQVQNPESNESVTDRS